MHRTSLFLSAGLVIVLAACLAKKDPQLDPRKSRAFRVGLLAESEPAPKTAARGRLKKLEISRYTDPAVAVTLFESGELDLLSGVPSELSRQLERVAGARWRTTGSYLTVLWGSTRQGQQESLRRALAHCTNRVLLAELSPRPLRPPSPLSVPELLPTILPKSDSDFSLSEARRHWRTVQPPPLHLVGSVAKSDLPYFENLATQWNTCVGIRVELSTTPGDQDFSLAWKSRESLQANPRANLVLAEKLETVLIGPTVTGVRLDPQGQWDFSEAYWTE